MLEVVQSLVINALSLCDALFQLAMMASANYDLSYVFLLILAISFLPFFIYHFCLHKTVFLDAWRTLGVFYGFFFGQIIAGIVLMFAGWYHTNHPESIFIAFLAMLLSIPVFLFVAIKIYVDFAYSMDVAITKSGELFFTNEAIAVLKVMLEHKKRTLVDISEEIHRRAHAGEGYPFLSDKRIRKILSEMRSVGVITSNGGVPMS